MGQKNMALIHLSWFSISFTSSEANKIYSIQQKQPSDFPSLSAPKNPTEI